MPLDHRTDLLDSDEEPTLLSRRGLLRRSVYGITGIGLVSVLAACDDDDDEDEAEGPTGLEDVDEDAAGEEIAPGAGLDEDEGEIGN